MANDELVMVSLMGKRSFRPGKGQPTINYKPGIVSMSKLQAMQMGLLHRIVQVEPYTADEQPVAAQPIPFDGRFNEKAVKLLTDAGYNSLEDLDRAGRDELLAIKGMGPALFEQIQVALHGAG